MLTNKSYIIKILLLITLVYMPQKIEARNAIPIQIEHLRSHEELQWGLMNRKEMPDSFGALFHFPCPYRVSVWMFNVWVDLSILFLNEDNVITEIQHAKAKPELLDPKRPIHTLEDIQSYSSSDFAMQYFQKNSIQAKQIAYKVLEVKTSWLKTQDIQVGDQVQWTDNHGFIIPLQTAY